jgi:hypothetical protein
MLKFCTNAFTIDSFIVAIPGKTLDANLGEITPKTPVAFE